MPTYTVWYSESTTSKATFTADNAEHAEQLLEQIQDRTIDIDDLPSVSTSIKESEFDIEPSTLEEF